MALNLTRKISCRTSSFHDGREVTVVRLALQQQCSFTQYATEMVQIIISVNSQHMKEASTHKSAKTHAGNVCDS